jgi:uncharacterized protein (TIGR00730 family)
MVISDEVRFLDHIAIQPSGKVPFHHKTIKFGGCYNLVIKLNTKKQRDYQTMKHICVYCGSSDRIPQVYLDDAYQMGVTLAKQGMILVYGAGSTGQMGAIADGALMAGGEVWGVIPKMFDTPQLAHKGLTRYEVVENIHARKARMIEISDGFIALPGGFGTYEELFEVITWAQIGLHRKPIGLLNTRGYYDPLLAMVSHADSEGFIYSEHRQLFTYADTPEALMEAISNHHFPEGLERWVERND